MYCPNESCPVRVRHGVIAEYQPGVTVCADCGTRLVSPPAERLAYQSPAALRLQGRTRFAGSFFRQPAVPLDAAGWIIDTYAWLRRDPVLHDYAANDLVEPSDAFFPIQAGPREATARAVFEATRRHAGMERWPCELVPDPKAYAEHVHVALPVIPSASHPLGTFSVPESWRKGARITYDPELMTRPLDLVATFAHELAHYLSAAARKPAPGGEHMLEPSTDLVAVFLGFGVFQATSAFEFRQYSARELGDRWIGWRVHGAGYLNQAELSFALALFLRVRGIAPERALAHLRGNPRTYLKRALRQLDSAQDELARLRAIQPPAVR